MIAAGESVAPARGAGGWVAIRLAAERWLGVELSVVSGREKVVSAAGGCLAIFLLVVVCSLVLPLEGAAGVIASMGASAVLLFAVPHGQLSQPWPVVAGHVVSALIGVGCARFIPVAPLAAACAVGLAIGAMHGLRCIHPPGGATALTAVVGGDAVHALGFDFVWAPVLLNAVLMVALAVVFGRLSAKRRYPAGAIPLPARKPATNDPDHETIVHALRSLDSFVDITENDLIALCRDIDEQRRKLRAPSRQSGVPSTARRSKSAICGPASRSSARCSR